MNQRHPVNTRKCVVCAGRGTGPAAPCKPCYGTGRVGGIVGTVTVVGKTVSARLVNRSKVTGSCTLQLLERVPVLDSAYVVGTRITVGPGEFKVAP